MTTQPPDEMVDGRGGLRAHWRGVLGGLTLLGDGGLAERARRLDRAFEEEGVTGLLPGVSALEQPWRCDPVPLPLSAGEFLALEAGLARRAVVLQALLADLHGPRRVLAEGVVPPGLVYANPGFLRLGPMPAPGGAPVLQFYAADLVRGPGGRWLVLADRTGTATGIAYARENRRLLNRVVPELFRPVQVRQMRPFFDVWQEALRALSPAGGAMAVLTPGTASRQWFEHMYLSRELSCALVEGGDLTVRGGQVFLKTLRGLRPVDVILSRVAGALLDPLELDAGSHVGVPGLLGAVRAGTVRVANDPGAAVLEAPGLAAFLPAVARLLCGGDAGLEGVPARWLGEAAARAAVQQAPSHWLLRSAVDGDAAAQVPGALEPEARAALWRRVEERPWAWLAQAALPGSLAPSLDAASGRLQPRPVVLRMFLAHDGARWHAMAGGLAEVLEEGVLPGARGATHGQRLTKDVWVLREESEEIVGPPVQPAPRLALRRASGDLPSRVADNMFWLGRYVERLDRAARLVRAALVRLSRGAAMLPREGLEVQVLARCLAAAGVIPAEEAGAAAAMTLPGSIRDSLRERGAVHGLLGSVAGLVGSVRDRVTAEMHAIFSQALRTAREEAGLAARDGALERVGLAMAGLSRFATAVAGLAAENMVRGGGWLFLDLGRRLERAQAVTTEVGFSIGQAPARMEAGLRLALELCDSAITYRSRYFNVLQAAPVLDLVLADQGNPRGLAFQLVAMHEALDSLDEAEGPAAFDGAPRERLAAAAAGILAGVESMVGDVLAAPDQAVAAAAMSGRLASVADDMAALSNRITRRYFALLPEVQTLGLSGENPAGESLEADAA
jgi:uncharacterized circularly permuted ATP-grasp superfamily protein/uncharacterized alpha-E superfamily protein